MRKTNQSNQSNQPNRGGSNQRKSSGKPTRNNNQGQNRGNSSAKRNEAAKLWMQASSQTLSSHIPMIVTSGKQTNSRNNEQSNGNGTSDKNKTRNKSTQDKNRPNKFRSNAHHKKHVQPKAKAEPIKSNIAESGSTDVKLESPKSKNLVSNIDPFELFCAYHLGISADKTYKMANINQVASRFRVEPSVIHTAVKSYAMDSASLLDLDFDMALAQLDIQVAPEGVDRLELAKGVYEEFLEAPKVKRDWKKMIEEDRKENLKVFGN